MKTVKIILSIIVMLAFLGLNGAMGQTWWAQVYTTNNIINTNSGSVYIGSIPIPPPSGISLLEVAKSTTEPTITVRNLGGTGGAAFRMCDKFNNAEWKFKLTYPNGDFKIRDNKYGRDVFTIEANSPHLFMYIKAAGSLGIGTPTPNNSALVDMTSTTKGFLPPRMTASQRTAIVSPAAGLLVFQTDALSGYYYYTGIAWTALGGNSGFTHYIGESYGGGIVFYVYDNGQHGLIAATADQSTGILWYGGSYTNTRARAEGVGAGLKNTSIIIANQGPVDGDAFAATVCNEYSVTVGGVTYGDWYLPSKYELNLLYQQRVVVGGFAIDYYWSSSESNVNDACLQDFGSDGHQFVASKSNSFYVRAVRAF